MSRFYFYGGRDIPEGLMLRLFMDSTVSTCHPIVMKTFRDSAVYPLVKVHRKEATQCWRVAGPAQVLCLCLPRSAPLLHAICCQGVRAHNVHEDRR